MLDYFKTLLGSTSERGQTRPYQNIRPAKAQELMKEMGEGTYEIIDVRTPEEYNSGHVEGAKHMNLFDSNFGDKVAQLDQDKTYFLICRSGNRSGSACSVMSQNGFDKLYNISGGMISWK